jgi:anti-sigma B factor antagonist
VELAVDRIGSVTVVKLPVDNLDASNTKEFKRQISPLLEAKAKLVFDLAKVNFVDSSGLGALLSCLRQVNAEGGDLKICGLTKQVRVIFELVRLHRIFEMFNTREEAAKAFD